MALITEDGSVVAGAESYATVAFCDTYHSNFGNAAWAALTTAQKEQYLRRATQHMLQMYRPRWKGYRKDAAQILDWPRSFVYQESFIHGAVGSYPYLVSDTIVPNEVKTACADLALKASTETLLPDGTQQIAEETIGPITVKYDPYSPANKQYFSIDAILSPYLSGIGNVSVGLMKG